LSRLWGWQLSGLLCDIVNLYKKRKILDDTAMSFPHSGGQNCNPVVVPPETKSYANFSKVKREKQWIAHVMKHISSEKVICLIVTVIKLMGKLYLQLKV
jgi:hypothetical protein